MAFADSSSTRLAYIPEATFGTTPTSPVFQILRYTGEQLRYQKNSIISDEIREDRNIADLIQVGRMVNGTFDFELSYGTFDDLLEGVFFNDWAADVLINSNVKKGFTFEKKFEQGATDSYLRYRGCVIGGMSLDLSSQKIATGQFSIMGLGGSVTAAILSGATYTAANTNPVMNTSSHFASLSISGVSPAPRIKGLTIQIENNLREQAEVGNIDLAGIAAGRFNVSGTMDAYFESIALYEAILDHDTISLEFTVGVDTGEKYTFELPSIKIKSGDPFAPGNDTDVMIPIEFQAIYDAGETTSIKVTRAVA